MENLTFNSEEERIEKTLEVAKDTMVKGYEVVNATIDTLNSSSLKRVLKAITGILATEAILELNPEGKRTLNEQEQSLIDRLYAFQGDNISFFQLMQEVNANHETEVQPETQENSNE